MNSVHTDTNFCARPSTVAKAIFEKGGTDFQNKLVQKTSGRMEYGHIAVTEGGGNLRCKAVYHACFDKTPTSQEEVICAHHIRNQSFFLTPSVQHHLFRLYVQYHVARSDLYSIERVSAGKKYVVTLNPVSRLRVKVEFLSKAYVLYFPFDTICLIIRFVMVFCF